VSINNYSVFSGTIICNNGALGALNTGVALDGRALTTTGALTTTAMTAIMPEGCNPTGISNVNTGNTIDAVTITPNPFNTTTKIKLNEASLINNCELKIYNVVGIEVMHLAITQILTTLYTGNLPSGVYFYTLTAQDRIIQSRKLVSQQ
jgi:hypothetical protein